MKQTTRITLWVLAALCVLVGVVCGVWALVEWKRHEAALPETLQKAIAEALSQSEASPAAVDSANAESSSSDWSVEAKSSADALLNQRFILSYVVTGEGTPVAAVPGEYVTLPFNTVQRPAGASGLSLDAEGGGVWVEPGWWSVEARAPAYRCQFHNLRLITALGDELDRGVNAYSRDSQEGSQTVADLVTLVHITEPTRCYLQHYVQTNGGENQTLGKVSGGETERYASWLWQKLQ